MARGEQLSAAQRVELERLLRLAEEQSGLAFGLYLGAWQGGRGGVEAMVAQMSQPDRSVMIAVDPSLRQVEIVTGRLARIALDDRACGLAVLSMTSSFSAGDLVGGLRDGLTVLGEHGRRQRVEYLTQP